MDVRTVQFQSLLTLPFLPPLPLPLYPLPEEASLPPALRQLQAQEDRQKRQQAAMEAMAAAAQKLLAAPEDNVSELRTLNALVVDKDMAVRTMCGG